MMSVDDVFAVIQLTSRLVGHWFNVSCTVVACATMSEHRYTRYTTMKPQEIIRLESIARCLDEENVYKHSSIRSVQSEIV